MTYEEKEDSREVILVGYYNVLFYLIFRVGLDEYKKDILIERIRSGERMVMKDIYRWCEGQYYCFSGADLKSPAITGCNEHSICAGSGSENTDSEQYGYWTLFSVWTV